MESFIKRKILLGIQYIKQVKGTAGMTEMGRGGSVEPCTLLVSLVLLRQFQVLWELRLETTILSMEGTPTATLHGTEKELLRPLSTCCKIRTEKRR